MNEFGYRSVEFGPKVSRAVCERTFSGNKCIVLLLKTYICNETSYISGEMWGKQVGNERVNGKMI